ncbi:MAG: heme o synthase [Spirosomataceae bacterium]
MFSNTTVTRKDNVIETLKAYVELLKVRLSLTVAFSGAFGYLLGVEHFTWGLFLLFSLAGFLLTGSSNIVNQIIERDSDKLMKRTQVRPLPTGRLSVIEAAVFSVILLLISCLILFNVFNVNAGWVGFISFLLYSFAYTPLKKVGPIAVFIGAFPGAFPPMIGWLAATRHFGLEPGILFAIQFFWQFPHFWAIAWVADQDYKKAGIRLLPGHGQKDLRTALNIMLYTLFLIPLSWVPYELGMTGITSTFVAVVCGGLFLVQAFRLMQTCTDKAALQMMFGSFIYLPVVQIAFLLDKV